MLLRYRYMITPAGSQYSSWGLPMVPVCASPIYRHYSGHRHLIPALFGAPAQYTGTVRGTGTVYRQYLGHTGTINRHYSGHRHNKPALFRAPALLRIGLLFTELLNRFPVVPSDWTGTVEGSGAIQPALYWKPPTARD